MKKLIAPLTLIAAFTALVVTQSPANSQPVSDEGISTAKDTVPNNPEDTGRKHKDKKKKDKKEKPDTLSTTLQF